MTSSATPHLSANGNHVNGFQKEKPHVCSKKPSLNGKEVYSLFEAEYLPRIRTVFDNTLRSLMDQYDASSGFDIEFQMLPVLRSKIEELKASIFEWFKQKQISDLTAEPEALWTELTHRLFKKEDPISWVIRESAHNDLCFVDYVKGLKPVLPSAR
jgi:hypothetical protein